MPLLSYMMRMVNWVNQFLLMILIDDQDVIKLLHAINLRQELVDHSVVHARAAGTRASLLADGIQLIEDDDMEAAVGSQLGQVDFKNYQFNFVFSIKHVEKYIERLSPSSALPQRLRTVCGCSPQTLLHTC